MAERLAVAGSGRGLLRDIRSRELCHKAQLSSLGEPSQAGSHWHCIPKSTVPTLGRFRFAESIQRCLHHATSISPQLMRTVTTIQLQFVDCSDGQQSP